MKSKLQELEDRYFMLNMKDNWDSSDYKYAAELRCQIKELKEKLNEQGTKAK